MATTGNEHMSTTRRGMRERDAVRRDHDGAEDIRHLTTFFLRLRDLALFQHAKPR
jgi:hypothetical protein